MTAGGPRPGSGRARTPDDQRSVTVTLRLPPDLAQEIARAADSAGSTRTAVIVARLRRWNGGRNLLP
jgi:hypothetical protein